MQTELIQFSIVVLGKVHNPTILNPDFLAIRQIVPKEWEWQVSKGSITTPPFSLVRYEQGVSIAAELDKLTVADGRSKDPGESKVPIIAKQYVAILPHVRYTAVGTNFQSAIHLDTPGPFLKERFLKPGDWDVPRRPLEALGLRLVYPLPGGRLMLSLDIGEVQAEDGGEDQRDVLLASANFHRDCATYPAADHEVPRHIDLWLDDWASFKVLIRDVLGIEWHTK